jgi:hypothetical protein
LEGVALRVYDYDENVISFWEAFLRVLGCDLSETIPSSNPISREYPGPAQG